MNNKKITIQAQSYLFSEHEDNPLIVKIIDEGADAYFSIEEQTPESKESGKCHITFKELEAICKFFKKDPRFKDK